MKNKSNIITALLLTAGLTFTSCNDWTEMESIDIKKATIEEQNPELYARYLQNLRQYKESEHQQVYAWFDNREKTPFTRAQHLTELPDSIDAVVLDYPENLADWEMKEMTELQSKKGTKVIYDLNFDSIKVAYNRSMEILPVVNEEGGEEEEPEPIAKEFEDFLIDSLQAALQLTNRYNYDGFCISYTGKEAAHMSKNEKNEYIQNENIFLGIIADWHQRNAQKSISFKGKPQNVINKSYLEKYSLIFAIGTEATNLNMLAYEYSFAITEGVPDRVGIIITTQSTDPSDKTTGYLSGALAISQIAEWAAAPQGGREVAGVGIFNVANDYYYTDKTYKYTRNVISSLNPSIK